MSWWWAIALGYLVVSWIGCPIFMKVCGSADRKFWAELSAVCRNNWFRQSLVLTVFVIVFGPLYPFILAHCFWTCWMEERASRKFWRKFRRTHRLVEFERLHPANLPRAAQEHIERHSPVLQGQGFIPAGVCRLKPDPVAIYAQCLLSREGETVADIALIDDNPTVSFVSILENGHVLETGCSPAVLSDDDLEQINRSGRFTAQMLQWGSDETILAGAYQRHLELLAELEHRYECGTLHVAADQIPDVKRYENVVFGNVGFELGKFDNRLEMLPCPIAPVRRISSEEGSVAVRELCSLD